MFEPKTKVLPTIIFCFLLSLSIVSSAQKKQKYTNIYDTTRIDSGFSLEQLKNASFYSLISKSFGPTSDLTVGWKTYKQFRLDKRLRISETTHYFNYKSILYKLKRKHKKMHKHAKEYRVSLKKISLDSSNIVLLDTTSTPLHYARITHYCHIGDKQKIQIHYLAIRMQNAWYIMDEIEMESWRIRKKKRRKY